MQKIVIATPNPEQLSVFCETLRQLSNTAPEIVGNATAVLETLDRTPPSLMILDQKFETMAEFDLVRTILVKNALINMAVISDMADDQFHDETEGLGILMQLPQRPGAAEAKTLWNKHIQILGL